MNRDGAAMLAAPPRQARHAHHSGLFDRLHIRTARTRPWRNGPHGPRSAYMATPSLKASTRSQPQIPNTSSCAQHGSTAHSQNFVKTILTHAGHRRRPQGRQRSDRQPHLRAASGRRRHQRRALPRRRRQRHQLGRVLGAAAARAMRRGTRSRAKSSINRRPEAGPQPGSRAPAAVPRAPSAPQTHGSIAQAHRHFRRSRIVHEAWPRGRAVAQGP